jgi:hypothetical protein
MVDDIWSNVSRTISWLLIPENANQEIEKKLQLLQWKKTTGSVKGKAFVILDDPWKRWLRAVVSEFKKTTSKSLNIFSEDDLIDFVLQHRIINCGFNANLQIFFINHYQTNNFFTQISYFKMSEILGYQLNHWLHDNGIANQFNNSIVTDNTDKELYNKLSEFILMDINRPYYNKVLTYLEQDYKLYNSTQFYAR